MSSSGRRYHKNTHLTPPPNISMLPSLRMCFKILSADGELLSHIKYHLGFMAERLGCISSLAFHPHSLVLAAGATDSIISIFAPEDWNNEDA